ncbi:alpha/beta fold hydrolase [Nesterenkonia aurantiaca]|uniref:Proline iminopeptidase n=1 Tax=Nesterenkonia aurantiaca TaxID=1436010 RepID=A0A4R7FVR8_9MICC|nr:alpha/beta fold hydrolase [Nesterenkonia aurantiaca]TDS82687.1 proline iminopeptidase [Nesterenkonia aurantiaca]
MRPARTETAGTRSTLIDGTQITDHRLGVPLDHQVPRDHQAPLDHAAAEGETISLYAREFVAAEAVRQGREHVESLPWLLFLQGGPGGKGSRPAKLGGWMSEAGAAFRILMLDQRGTGLSAPLTRDSLAAKGDPAAQAAHMRHFRADSIVKDAEAFRRALGLRSWSVLGQSFGGFATLSYLSFAPESLDRALITGGLAPLQGHADRVYRATYPKMRARNYEHFARFPQDREILDAVFAHLRAHQVALLDGSALTPARLQLVGMLLGGNTRADSLHYLLQEAFTGPDQTALSDTFLATVGQQLSFAGNPMYAVMHESIYGQPAELTEGRAATGWAAQRVGAEFPEFDAAGASPLLLGEMILREHLLLDPTLHDLVEVADLLAAVEDWEPLYDLTQLRRNRVPTAAALYTDDVYVARELSWETADLVGGISVWETSEFHHDGLGDDGARVFAELLKRT